MKAVFIKEHGGPEALTFGDRPEPEVGPGEVMLRVGASAFFAHRILHKHYDRRIAQG